MNKELYNNSYKLYQEISAGGVVIVQRDGHCFVVTIERGNVKDFSLPKGHQNPGESLQDTAIREVYEETGYKAQPITYLDSFTYFVQSDKQKTITIRTVHWFFMKATNKSDRKADCEVKRVCLTPVENNFSFLTYDNDRMFIEKVKELLKQKKIFEN